MNEYRWFNVYEGKPAWMFPHQTRENAVMGTSKHMKLLCRIHVRLK